MRKNEKGGLNMGFPDILHSLAEEKNLTQKQLAAEIGVPASTMGGYFQGTSEPDLEMVKRLAQYFGCSVDYLLGNPSAQSRSFQEDTLIRVFRSMPEDKQNLYVELGKTIVKVESKTK